MDSLLLSFGSVRLEWQTALLCFLSAFVLSSAIAKVYESTFFGLSYSRGLLHAMILGSLISCLLMIAIGDNIARGIGIVGSLAIIRFRTNLREPRDLVFLFASLGVGVACGVQSFVPALIGTSIFIIAALILHRSEWGSRNRNDGLVRFQAPPETVVGDRINEALRSIPRHFALVTMRDVAQGELVDYAYQVKFAKVDDATRLMRTLEDIEGLRGLTYMNQQTTVEL